MSHSENEERSPRASWIIVSYNTCEVTLQCLRSLAGHQARIEQEVIVVDNASTDGTADAIASEFPRVHLVRSRENLGFARGTNKGLSEAKGDLLILLNPDTLVHEGALDALVEFFETHPEAGMAGGKLLNEDGSVQWSQRRFPSLTRQLAEALYLHFLFPNRPWVGEIDKDLGNYQSESNPDWVSGAFLAARREVLQQIGPLDERYFMYIEDMDWCYSCRMARWQIAYVPGAVATHFGELSSSQSFEHYYPRLIHSRLLFNRKHFGVFRRAVLRILLGLTLLQRIVVFVFTIPFLKKRKYSAKTLLASRLRGFLVALFGTPGGSGRKGGGR